MTGRRLPLNWPGRIRDRVRAEVFTLLDAAALVSTAPLDIGALSETSSAPDFVSLSFYKIFGFPNLGALLVKKSASRILQGRKFFGGGTVEMVICMNDNWVSKKHGEIHESLEDGTLPFTSIFALDIAIVSEEVWLSLSYIVLTNFRTRIANSTGLNRCNGSRR